MARKKKWKMPAEALTAVATRFRVLSEPLRLQILQELETGRLSVGALAAAVGSTQPNVSKHLKILQDEGLIGRRKEGNAAYYSIADPSVFELCDVVCSRLKAEIAARHSIFK
jgi:DNA-binding transcriptional ArsR family regulator